MQPTDWPSEHSEALRQLLASGLSYSRIAEAINARFGAAYSRNAAIGRAKRMGLDGPACSAAKACPASSSRQPRIHRIRERGAPDVPRSGPVIEVAQPVRLRCVEIVPRHLSLVDLEPGDCRYPYGGEAEGDAITFCGHPRRQGASYCTAHFHLTREAGTVPERAAGRVLLRIVEAA